MCTNSLCCSCSQIIYNLLYKYFCKFCDRTSHCSHRRMIAKRIRALREAQSRASRCSSQRRAGLFKMSDEQNYLHEAELEAVNMKMPFIAEALTVNKADYFAWMATKSESLGLDKFQIDCESAHVIQTNRRHEIRPQHQCEENDLSSELEQDFFMPGSSIHPELTEFWSHRANARLDYGISKPLRSEDNSGYRSSTRINTLVARGESCGPTNCHDTVMCAGREQFVTRHDIPLLVHEKPAMAASKPANAVQRAASTSQAPPPREPVLTKRCTKQTQ